MLLYRTRYCNGGLVINFIENVIGYNTIGYGPILKISWGSIIID